MNPPTASTNGQDTFAGGTTPAATAFVLAGGESSRMGRDKALLELPSGETMLRRALHTAKQAAGKVVLVAPEGRYPELQAEFQTISDIHPGRGPLSGIHAALCYSATEWNLVLGVDSPRVTPELLRFLLTVAAGAAAALAVVPRVAGRLHTVCAAYRKAFAQTAERDLLAAGLNSASTGFAAGSRHHLPRRQEQDLEREPRRGTRIERLLAQVPSRILEEEELRRAGFGAELFANVNTPDDFAALGFARGDQSP